MNYLLLIKWFWRDVPDTEGYKPLYGMLFLAIVDGINANYWRPNTFIDYDRIAHKCKFTKEVYLKGRKWLMEKELIDFIPGKNNIQMASFSLGHAVLSAVGKPTGKSMKGKYENLPASLPARLPINKQVNGKTFKNKTNLNGRDNRKYSPGKYPVFDNA